MFQTNVLISKSDDRGPLYFGEVEMDVAIRKLSLKPFHEKITQSDFNINKCAKKKENNVLYRDSAIQKHKAAITFYMYS